MTVSLVFAVSVDTKVISLDSVETVHIALFESQDDAIKVCFGSDVTVVGITPYAPDDHYSPVPITASPSDKHEKGADLAKWLETVLDTWKTHPLGERINRPIWALGTDGDVSYCLAKQTICVYKQVDKSTPLGSLLSSLLCLNCYTSKDGTTGTCDPKHIFKWFATLLQSTSGFTVNDANIRPGDNVDQLALLPNMFVDKACQLLDPSDKKNVPKAVTLVQSLFQLKDLSASLNPTVNQHQHAIAFIANMMNYFMWPFISINMTLSEQVRSLATYTFLAAAVQIKHGTACLTGPLYADSHATVKNIIFTIARMQVMDSSLLFYILLEGTDHLEGLFGDCRTQDHAQNFDIEQLAGKLSVATIINAGMESNPDLDRGHQHLSLKDAMAVDHVNQKSWTGDVCVGDVDLNIQWK